MFFVYKQFDGVERIGFHSEEGKGFETLNAIIAHRRSQGHMLPEKHWTRIQ